MATRKQNSRHFEKFTISRALTPTWHRPEQQDQPFESKNWTEFHDGPSLAHPHQLKSPLLASAKMFQMKTFSSFAASRKKLLMKIVSVDFPGVGPYDQNYFLAYNFISQTVTKKGGQSCWRSICLNICWKQMTEKGLDMFQRETLPMQGSINQRKNWSAAH